MHRNSANEARIELVSVKSECAKEIDLLKKRIVDLEKGIVASASFGSNSDHHVKKPIPGPDATSIRPTADEKLRSDPLFLTTDPKVNRRTKVESVDERTITWERSSDTDRLLQSALETLNPQDREAVEWFVAQGDHFRTEMSPSKAAALEAKTEFLMNNTLADLEQVMKEGSEEDQAAVREFLGNDEVVTYIGEMMELLATSLVDPNEGLIPNDQGNNHHP